MLRRISKAILAVVVIATLCLSVDAGAAVQQRARLRLGPGGQAGAGRTLRVITTLPDYAALAKAIGGDWVEVESIVHPIQDPHHIRPKPSFVNMVRRADMIVSTGLDLEMWLPTVVNKAGNKRLRSGEIGYVAVTHGMMLLEKPPGRWRCARLRQSPHWVQPRKNQACGKEHRNGLDQKRSGKQNLLRGESREISTRSRRTSIRRRAGKTHWRRDPLYARRAAQADGFSRQK